MNLVYVDENGLRVEYKYLVDLSLFKSFTITKQLNRSAFPTLASISILIFFNIYYHNNPSYTK